MRLISWILSLFLAFAMGTGYDSTKSEDKSELAQKVQDHMDVIVDESAAIVDDVLDEIRNDDKVKKTEEFFDDVREIADNTVDDIHAHFDKDEETEEVEEEEEEEAEETEDGAEEAEIEETEDEAPAEAEETEEEAAK